ncbi:metal-dependent hydrolase [Thermococcus sp.]|uniref:metal-dependent hydrolase n=1 Tax=Thermococcus sp. TaxID=35749 RepID=UPI0026058C6A|nr:metal-dependent hydrolase [Thermococcus sp.]
MPNYDAHVLSGIVTYPVAVLIAYLLKLYAGVPVELTAPGMVIGYALYVLGSDLPDMDHPKALIHRGTKPIVSVATGSAVFIWSQGFRLSKETWINTTLQWTLGAVSAVIAWFAFTAIMPKHRGIVHSLLFAGIYAILAYALVDYGLRMGLGVGLYCALSAFLGYTLHLLLDRSVKLV